MELPNSGKFELFDISESSLLLAQYGRDASDRLLLALVHDLSINLSSLDVLMPEELGDRVEVGTERQHHRCEGVAG